MTDENKKEEIIDWLDAINTHHRKIETLCELLSLYGICEEASASVMGDAAGILLNELKNQRQFIDKLRIRLGVR